MFTKHIHIFTRLLAQQQVSSNIRDTACMTCCHQCRLASLSWTEISRTDNFAIRVCTFLQIPNPAFRKGAGGFGELKRQRLAQSNNFQRLRQRTATGWWWSRREYLRMTCAASLLGGGLHGCYYIFCEFWLLYDCMTHLIGAIHPQMDYKRASGRGLANT